MRTIERAELLFSIVTQHAELKEYWMNERQEVHIEALSCCDWVLLNLPKDIPLTFEERGLKRRSLALIKQIEEWRGW